MQEDRDDFFRHLKKACQKGNLNDVKRLIASTDYICCTDKSGNSLIHIVSEEGLQDNVQLLIERGADVNKVNNKGKHHC